MLPLKTKTQYKRPAKIRLCSRVHWLAWILVQFYFRCSPLCWSGRKTNFSQDATRKYKLQSNTSPNKNKSYRFDGSFKVGTINFYFIRRWDAQQNKREKKLRVCTRWKTTLTVFGVWSLFFFFVCVPNLISLYILPMRKRNPNMSKFWCHFANEFCCILTQFNVKCAGLC